MGLIIRSIISSDAYPSTTVRWLIQRHNTCLTEHISSTQGWTVAPQRMSSNHISSSLWSYREPKNTNREHCTCLHNPQVSVCCRQLSIRQFVFYLDIHLTRSLAQSVSQVLDSSSFSNPCLLIPLLPFLHSNNKRWCPRGPIYVNIPSIIQTTARLCVYSSRLCYIYTDRQISM